MREDGLQLLDGGRAGRSVRCPVDATRQADRRVGVGEYVHAIHEDAGRPVKPQPLRLLDRLHEMACHRDVGPFGGDREEPLVGDLPVRAAME